MLSNQNMVPFGTAVLKPLSIAWTAGTGALWFNRPVLVHPRFEVLLRVTINDYGCNDGDSSTIDGLALMISNKSNFMGDGGGSLGYRNLYDAIVTEVDLYSNSELGDISSNSLSLHRCWKGLCTPTEDSTTVQRALTTTYDKCKRTVYEVRLIYSNGIFKATLGTTTIEVSENFSSRFEGDVAYLGFSGFFRSHRREYQIAGSYICEDDFDDSKYYYEWLSGSTLLAQSAVPTILAGATTTLRLTFNDVSSLKVAHTLGKQIWDWSLSVGSSCGTINAFGVHDNYLLTTKLANCNIAGSNYVMIKSSRNIARSLSFNVIARDFEVLQLAGYNNKVYTESNGLKTDNDGYVTLNLGSLNGDFTWDTDLPSNPKALIFDLKTTDSFDNLFSLGTDLTKVVPALALSATSPDSSVNVSVSVVSNGIYRISVPVTKSGNYYISSSKFRNDKKIYKFVIAAGRPSISKSTANISNYSSTPTLDVGASVVFTVKLYDDGGNVVTINTAKNYGFNFGCYYDRTSYDNRTSQAEVTVTTGLDFFSCTYVTAINGKFVFNAYQYTSSDPTKKIFSALSNTFYVQPKPVNFVLTSYYDFTTSTFTPLINKTAKLVYSTKSIPITLIDFFDTDQTSYGDIGYPASFKLTDITGQFYNIHDPTNKLSVRLEFILFYNKMYIAVQIDNQLFVRRTSHQYKLDLTYNGITNNISFDYPLGNVNGKEACVHSLSVEKTVFTATSGASFNLNLNSDSVIGTLMLATTDGYLFNYKIDISLFKVTFTPANAGSRAYIAENVNAEGFYYLRFFSTTANNYLVTLTISGSTIVNNYPVNVSPNPVIYNLSASSLNAYNDAKSTTVSKVLSTTYTTDTIPTIFFNGADDFSNALSLSPLTSNNYLKAKISLTINGSPASFSYNTQTATFTYDTTNKAYLIADYFKTPGVYLLTITSAQNTSISFTYNKTPGSVSSVTSTASTTSNKNLNIAQSATVSVVLKDTYGNNIASDETLALNNKTKISVTATAKDSSVINFAFADISMMAFRFTSDQIMKQSTYTVSVVYSDTNGNKVIPCSDCVFYVNYVQFDILKCQLAAVLSKTVAMSSNSILRVNNLTDKPLFNFDFYDSNNNQLQFVDQTSKLSARFTGSNLDIPMNLSWIGNNKILWTFPDNVNLANITGGYYSLNIYYNDVSTLTYPVQFLGDGNDSDAGNGEPNFDLTDFSTLFVRTVAGLNANFNIQFRTQQNLRVNSYGDLSLFSFSNSKALSTSVFTASVQLGAKKGEYIISINSRVTSTSTDPIVLSITYNGNKIKQTVSLIIKCAELKLLVPETGNILDSSKNTFKDGSVESTSNIIFTAYDLYGNIYDDIFTTFTNDKIAALFNLAHSQNAKVTATALADVNNKNLVLTVSTNIIGTVTLSSSFISKPWTYTVLPGSMSEDFTFGDVRTSTESKVSITAGETAYFYVYPRDKYNNVILASQLTTLDYTSISMNVNQPKGTTTLKNIAKSKNSTKNTVDFSVTLTEAGVNTFTSTFNGKSILCVSCSVNVKLASVVFTNSVLSIGTTTVTTTGSNTIPSGSIPTFSLRLYDSYMNLYPAIPDNFLITSLFSGNQASINFCSSNLNEQIQISVCQTNNDRKNWMYLVGGSGYSMSLTNNNVNLLFPLTLSGGVSNSDASNAQLDVSKTQFFVNSVNVVAGNYVSFKIELRAVDGKRKNFWYDNPNDNIKVAFSSQKASNYNSDVSMADNPGQYTVKISSTTTFTSLDNNLITLTIENVKCNSGSVLLIVNPNLAVSAAIIDSPLNANNPLVLKDGNADKAYSFNLRLYDVYQNIAEAETTAFSWTITAPNNKAVSSSISKSGSSFTITVLSIYSGVYQISSPMFKSAYSFTVLPGAPNALNSEVKAPTTATAGDNIQVFIIPFDTNNNVIDPSTLTNNYVLSYKYKDRVTQVYVTDIPITTFTVGNYTDADMPAKTKAFIYTLQVTAKGFNDFQASLGASTLKCINCMTNVAAGAPVFDKYKFQRYDVLSSSFVDLSDNSNEDNSKTDVIYRIAPRDFYKNVIDTIPDASPFSIKLVDKDGITYKLKSSLTSFTNVIFTEFVKNDDSKVNVDLTYNTLTGGSYTVILSDGKSVVNRSVILIGREGDSVASNQELNIQNTVINESTLTFLAGQTGSLLIELRTVNNLRKNNWNQNVSVGYQIVDDKGTILTGADGEDKSFSSSVRNAGVLGVFYATVTSTLSTTTLGKRSLQLVINVNGVKVNNLNPKLTVVPSKMIKASIVTSYIKTNSELFEGTADEMRFFKVAAYDAFNNPTSCDPDTLKLTAIGPDKNSVFITAGREATTGYATYYIDNKKAGTYTIGSNSGILPTYSFVNKFGVMSITNSLNLINDKILTAGNSASVNYTPRDNYMNLIDPKTVVSTFTATITSPSGKVLTADVTTSNTDIVFSKTLFEKGVSTWNISTNKVNINCFECTTTVKTASPLIVKSILLVADSTGSLKSYKNSQEFSVSIKNNFVANVALFDSYDNSLDSIPSDVVLSATISGNSMTTINMKVSIDKDKFLIVISDESKYAYSHLVSGTYSFVINLQISSEVNKFEYKLKLVNTERDDTGYGNGKYSVEKTELSTTSAILYAASTLTINMRLKTAAGLYYNDDIDLTKDVKFSISPADPSFTFKIYKKNDQYANYNMEIFSSSSQIGASLSLQLSIRDANDSTSFKNLNLITLTIKPVLPPDSEKTAIVTSPSTLTNSGNSITLAFKLFDNYGNAFYKNNEFITNNNLILTNNNAIISNAVITLKSDGLTFSVTFLPQYPPRKLSLNVIFKDDQRAVSIFKTPIETLINSDPYYPNTIVTGSNLNQMDAGSKIAITVLFFDKGNVCVDNIKDIPVYALVNGPLDRSDSSVVNYQYKFVMNTRNNTDASCVNQFVVQVPDNQVYTAVGTYKVTVNVGDNSYQASTFSQQVVPGSLDLSKFVSKYTMTGNFNPGRVVAGTEIAFTFTGNDKYLNPVTIPLLQDFGIRLVSKTGRVAVTDKDSPTNYDYTISLIEMRNGLITATMKILKSDNYLFNYLYKSSQLSSIDTSRGPFDISIVPGSCSPKFPSIVFKDEKILTATPTYFEIKCKDIYGNEILTGGEVFKIYLTLTVEETKTSTSIKTTVEDSKNGTYKVQFVPPMAGSYALLIDLNGEIYNSNSFVVKDNTCPEETPNRCPNDTTKCVKDLVDCIPNRKNCPSDKPFSCNVASVETCVESQTKCDCPTGMTKCSIQNVCVTKSLFCAFSLPVSCTKLYPNSKVFCPDGICRGNLSDSPAQRVCPIGFVLCPDLTCRDDYSKCAVLEDCPKKSMIRCSDQSCVNDQKDCPSIITCSKSGMYVCPDGTCVTSEVNCKALPTCVAPNSILCSNTSCVSDIKNCPKQVACGHGTALCNDIICRATCLA